MEHFNKVSPGVGFDLADSESAANKNIAEYINLELQINNKLL